MQTEIFVKNVEDKCKELGTNMTAASKAAGLSPNFMTKVKHGADPGLSSVVKLAHFLGCTVSDLLGEEKSSPPQQGSELQERFESLSPQAQEKLLQAAEILRADEGLP